MSKLSDVLVRAVGRPQVRSAVSDWSGKDIRLTDGGFWSDFAGGVNTNSAMKLSVVWACVRLISQTIATLPLTLYEQDGRKPMPAVGHQLYEILKHSPNADTTSVQFWEAVVASILLRGNAYIRKRYVAGRVAALYVLQPDRITIKCNDDGSLNYTYRYRGQAQELTRREMMHIAGFSLDGQIGLSAIQYGATTFGQAMSANDAAESTFQNGLHKTVAFKVDRVLRPEQREEFREYVKTLTGALNAGRSPVLEQGISAEPIGIDPTDAQLLESRSYSVEEICRFFGVPPIMIGHSSKQSSWPTSTEAQKDLFLTLALRPILKRIEESIYKNLLESSEKRSFYARFNLEGLLRADSAGRSEYYSKLAQNGVMTRNEIRELEDMAPMPGGDDLTVQLNLTRLQDLEKINGEDQ
ncbi:phage portal protein [Comamonas serinivorans]|uniref:Phage portal protein n=1 Tax=Comamonas serinivorans TaxID=1082851 RepID=A0A1Y0EMC5_9BURK|nr:phage portal protein [Comamonas serinivorans]ARU04747.1 phage portal protein [Comamonas serinivorans]